MLKAKGGIATLSESWGETDMQEKMPMKREEYQLDLNKIWDLDDSKRDTVLQLVKVIASNGDYENKEIVKNTLKNYGIIITKREDSLNKLV